MTLLELLRQELPKRGGWPEGAVCFAQDIDGFVAGYKRKPISGYNGIWDGDGYLNESGWWSKTLTRDREIAIVTHEQYEATGWDGTGLPPVGMKVEWLSDKYGWLGGTVAAHDAKYPLIAIIRHNDGYTGCHRHELRTEAERAIDEMVRLSGVSIGAAKILHDAGYRKG